MPERTFCDHCGHPAGDGGHAGCLLASELEPPRFCPYCGRRMKVQVTPLSWTAACVQHGTTAATDR